ncbi:MAG: enoyl-CoA hydratase [Acidimicrobiales bacterium]|nr:enoyl-CoA hydratase [Acidimicrobiales bacterium]
MTAPTDLLTDTNGPVRTLTLNRPDAKNSLTASMLRSLMAALYEADTDPTIRVIILTNSGNTFCAGADLTADRPGVAAMIGGPSEKPASLAELFVSMQSGATPIIGRIDGHAVGGGVGLVAACDLSYVRSDAKIGFTEVRLGVAPAVISVVCLPKLSRADAMETFLSGERFSPTKAAEIGLINAAVAPENLHQHVDATVNKILKGGPSGIAAAKNLVYTVPTMDRAEALAWTTELSQALFDSEEAKAGIAAYRQRRPAPWDESS